MEPLAPGFGVGSIPPPNPASANRAVGDRRQEFEALLRGPAPILALAPMQDVADRSFWELIARYGGADVYFTEYFRVHETSRLERWILDSINRNPTGQPIVAQLIGNHVPSLVRAARELQQHPVAAVDFNLGCPAPVVYRKFAGGGLLRDLDRIDAVLGALREAVQTRFSVKTRVGFDSPAAFDELLAVFARHSLDLLTVHARTVKEMYRPTVRYDLVAKTVSALACPVIANGDITSAAQAAMVLRDTGARGIMIGRGAVRNPWLFDQVRRHLAGQGFVHPRGREVLAYVQELYESQTTSGLREADHVERMKKFMNYLGVGVEPTGRFLHDIRRVRTRGDFFRVCGEHLDHEAPMPLVPFGADPDGCKPAPAGR